MAVIILIGFGSTELANALNPQPLPPRWFGFDLFQTTGGTFATIGGIPVPLQGMPIGPGNTDTIVQRLSTTTGNCPFSPPSTVGGTGTIPIEIVSLSLESTAPVNIGGSFFDVFVSLVPAGQTPGCMMINWGDNNGGTFDSTLPVVALVKVTQVGSPGNTQQFTDTLVFSSTGSPWSTNAPSDPCNNAQFPSGGFNAGVDPTTGGRGTVTEGAPGFVHSVTPATCPPTAVGGEILPINMTSLFLAGVMTNAFWMVPTLGGIAGAAFALFRVKRKHN